MAVTNPHPWTDDDGSGTTGTIVNNAALQNIYNDVGPETSTTTLTGVQTALAIPSGVGPLTIYCNNASLLSIKGIAAGIDGQILTLISIGAGQVDLYHQDVNATAANRLINFVTSGLTSLAGGVGTALLQYDAATARWRLVQHEQGAWITPTYAGGDFTANAGTWTVDAGDITTRAYYLRGRNLTYIFEAITTTTSAGMGAELRVKLPNGYTVAKQARVHGVSVNNAGPYVDAQAIVTAGNAYVSLYVDISATVAWAAGTNNNQHYFNISMEVN